MIIPLVMERFKCLLVLHLPTEKLLMAQIIVESTTDIHRIKDPI